jgi:hypothetical protein
VNIKRYDTAPLLALGKQYGTCRAHAYIRRAISAGTLRYEQVMLRGSERLDTMSGELYGDGRLWWILAAASNVGWSLQVPAGTMINVPDLNDVARLLMG